MFRAVIAGSLVLAGVMIPASAAAEAPGNDDVGSATMVDAIPFGDVVAVSEATVEVDEPTETCAPFANTVWYAVTLADATDVFIDTAGSNYDTTIAVWTGSSFADVELVACNDDTFQSLQAATTFTAEAGVTYLVQVGAFFEAPPDAVLTIGFGEPPKATGKPFIAKSGIRGQLANAYVDAFDDVTQTYSSRSVELLDGVVSDKGARPTSVRQLNVSSYEEQFDDATQTYTFTQWYGFANLEPGQFAIDRRLNEAWVATDLALFGQTCTDSPAGFECDDLGEAAVSVDVMWDGDGPLVRMRDRSSESFDAMRFRYRSNVSSRNALVDGGATGEMSIDLTGASGTIASGSNGSWFWSHGDGNFGFQGSFAALAEAAGLTGSQVMFDRFRGGFASAFDEEFDEETGAFSYRDVSLTIGQSKTKGGKWYSSEGVSVYSTTQIFDESQATVTSTEWYGFGPLQEGFIDRKLTRAEARADVTLTGVECTYSLVDGTGECIELGETTATVDVSWDGIGGTFTSQQSSSSTTSSEHVRFSGRSTSRAALANGVVDGPLVGWTLMDADGSMARNADGFWIKS